ncbi:MAG TPA: delta-60 repeat domain-containing protein, partial [Flavobacteriales bacterium]|nr:delta-60 repeat domain-containing protein [Flavobacteriales bacterium]
MAGRFFILCTSLFSIVTGLHAQLLDPRFGGFNGPVNAIVEDTLNDVVYVGGSFDRVGIEAPFGAVVTGEQAIVQAPAPVPNGRVNTAIPDGEGGYYIGGTFTRVGTVTRNRLARINADGSLHPWNPDADDEVSSLVELNGAIYAGGRFQQVGGAPHARLVELDPESGDASNWTPVVNDGIRVLVTDGTDLYLAGDFTTVEGDTRNKLAGYSVVDHTLLPWNPNVVGNVVLCFTWTGSSFVVGGSFSTAGGQPRNNIAAFAPDGSVTAWDPSCDGTVFAVTSDANTIYAGGSFSQIGGEQRIGL